MNALLIYPEWPDTYWSFRHALPFQGKRSAYPPLGLLTIAALLPSHWAKRLVDTNVRALKDSDLAWADVALVSGMLVQKDHLLVVLARCRARGLRTVVGGPIASGFSELSRYADHVVIGEAEELIAPLAEDLKRGVAKPKYQAKEKPLLERSPLPELGLINTRHYSSMAIQYSRGCPFNCEFCDIIEIYGRKPRTKSVPQVITELEQLYRHKWKGSVFLVDDNFIGNKKNVKQLLPAMAEWNDRHGRPFSFFTEASVNLADDPGLLAMMKAAGFIRVFLGIETPVEASLKEANKLQNTRRNLLDSVRCIQQHGIEVMAGFIVGFDNDPKDVFDRQVKFIQDSAIPIAMVGLLQALPGTQLHRRLEHERRLVSDADGNNIDCNLSFIPTMPAQCLLDGYRSILKRIYAPDAYYERVRRFLDRYHPTNHMRRPLSEYLALCRSIVRQGILGNARASYWRFLLDAATQYNHAFGAAVTLAIMGHHFATVTEQVCQSE
ncbi:MAG: B12-binding domain-containing radical SAM protein [Terriglobales bacterium]|jgi:radical SAM superfamily enzyme YgiQ (UPF0313 family)